MDEEQANIGREQGHAHYSPNQHIEIDDQDYRPQNGPRKRGRSPLNPTPPINLEDQDITNDTLPRKRGRVGNSPIPTINIDDNDAVPRKRGRAGHSPIPYVNVDEDDRPASPICHNDRTGSENTSNLAHETDDDEDEDDSESDTGRDESDDVVLVNKAPKLQIKSSRPKASDYDEFGKELVLSAANKYRALLASQGAFPNASRELKLIKKAWNMANAECGVKASDLTPSIVTIVGGFYKFYSFIWSSRSV